jgi:hypothetical protein
MKATNTSENQTPNLAEQTAPSAASQPAGLPAAATAQLPIKNSQSPITNPSASSASAPSPEQNPQSPIPASAPSASSPLNKPVPPPKPKFIDTWDIPFPKTLTELAALDATRAVPYLKSLCNRRFIHVPGPNPTPAEIIPYIQKRLDTHNKNIPQHRTEHSDLYLDWKLAHQDLTEFIQDLRNLLPPSVPSVSSENSVSIPIPSTNPTQPKNPKTSGHSNNSHAPAPKTPAIQTNAAQHPKTLGHSNNPSPKNSPAPHNSHTSHNSHISHCESATPQPTPPRRPRNNPLLAKLTHDQKQQLIDLYQNHTAKEAVRLARETLNIQISAGSLSNLATTWQIAEAQTTREDLEATHNASIEVLTQQQLQLRLLELASRPNMDTGELRAICQSFARLESLKLSQRRVQLAEAKENRLAKNEEPAPSFTPEEYEEGIAAFFGRQPRKKTALPASAPDAHSNPENPQSDIPNPQSEIPNPQFGDPHSNGNGLQIKNP